MKHFKSNHVTRTFGLIAVMALLMACKDKPSQETATQESGAEETAPTAKQQATIGFHDAGTEKLFRAYIELKDALVASDAAAAARAAATLRQEAGPDKTGLSGVTEAMVQAEGLEAQRALLPELTRTLEPVLRDQLSSGTVYKQFCPMAFDNTGGYWLSDAEEIRNPYFGDMMLKCGKVDDRLVAR